VPALSDHPRITRSAPWVGGTLMLVVAALLLYAFTGAAASEPSKSAQPNADDISYGPADAQLSVIEYSDFECPFCAQYAAWLSTLRERYGDRVQFVYRFFPLANHKYATIAAKVAYAASLQGKFWEMHDLLFGQQEQWSDASDPLVYFDSYATLIGLDLERFHKDADAQSTTDFITAQAAEGKAAGVKHTPWFVVGDEVVLPRSLEEFDKLIREAL
jgi:protein-disulfide isomerase